ncbi:hypothetical protein [Roseiconus lacunae]|uniref:hypothetical protein n=1 Tax=Roseiconus lacunae TaxID=2605694 RepID=UPI001E39D94A|nr:hypothetical protein [Roseiconus lacunae]
MNVIVPPTAARHRMRLDRSATRWQAANLYRNPFGELERAERAELAVVDVDRILRQIGSQSATRDWQFRSRAAFQLLGDCGRGKTTRMLAIGRVIPQAAYVYLPEDAACPTIPWGWPLLVDEAQRLPRRIRRLVFDSGVPLVLSSHRDLTGPLRRAGYDVHTDRIGLTLTAEKLTEILNRRVLASLRGPATDVPQITLTDAARLIERFGTDVRSIEGYLYDVVQQQVETDGELRFID